MHILIVDQCSASKAVESDAERTSLDDHGESSTFPDAAGEGIEARDLYTGKQQRRIETAVQTLRRNGHDVDRVFVSAGFGLVGETEELPPYDATFSTMSAAEIRERGRELSITEELLEVVDDTYHLVFFPLGADYYRAIDLDRLLSSLAGTRVVLFNREAEAERWEHVVSVPARTEQAREHGSTVVGLKGTYLEQFASRLGSDTLDLEEDEIRALLTSQDTTWTTVDDF